MLVTSQVKLFAKQAERSKIRCYRITVNPWQLLRQTKGGREKRKHPLHPYSLSLPSHTWGTAKPNPPRQVLATLFSICLILPLRKIEERKEGREGGCSTLFFGGGGGFFHCRMEKRNNLNLASFPKLSHCFSDSILPLQKWGSQLTHLDI